MTYIRIVLLCLFIGIGIGAFCQNDSAVVTQSTDSIDFDKMSKTTKEKIVLHGIASYYSNKFNGRKTASGEVFDQKKMTAACNQLPLGTTIRVSNPKNGKSVIVTINDRLNRKTKRLVDLTTTAAKKLDFMAAGITKVTVEVIKKRIK